MMAEQEDRISFLPDCVVGTIVSLLPPMAAARTMVLSRRWLHIWPSLPLDLNLDSSDSDVRFLSASSITSILSSHRGPIHRFCVTTLSGVGTRAWLKTLSHRRIDDTLILRWASDLEHPTLPRNLLGSAGVALRHLDLHCCRLGGAEDSCSPVPTLPRLDYLYLSNVLISETALHRMIEACPVLRELHLFMIDGLHRIGFCSNSLSIMEIGAPRVPLDEFFVRDTPNLESVTFSYVNLWRIPTLTIPAVKSVRVLGLKLPTVGSPRLNILPNKRILPFITSLVFGMKFAEGEELSKAINILSLFPCLQHLEIECCNFNSPNDEVGFGVWESEAQTIPCVKKHLKHVLFKGYCGTIGEVKFARYLTARSVFLTSMEIIHSVDWNMDDINRQKDSICISGKASSLTLYFTKSKDSDCVRRKVASFLDRVAII